MSNPDADLETIVTRAIAHEGAAVERLLRIIRPLVVRYCRTRLGGYERAGSSPDDVAQEVCLAVLKALPHYRDQGRPFLAFVYGIAAHRVVDAHRSVARDRSDPVAEAPEGVDKGVGPEQHTVNGESLGTLLDRLPPKQRQILTLRVVMGLSAEETADAVGSTPGAVRVAQHRALSWLRETLAAEAAGVEQPAAVAVGAEAFSDDPLGVGALVDAVVAAPPEGHEDELALELEGADPKEFRAYAAVLEDVRAQIDTGAAAEALTERYRHRQLTKEVQQRLAGRLDEGASAALAARRMRRSPRDERAQRGDEPGLGLT